MGFIKLAIHKDCLETVIGNSYGILPRLSRNYDVYLFLSQEDERVYEWIDKNYHKESIIFTKAPIMSLNKLNFDIFITASIKYASLALKNCTEVILFNRYLNKNDKINPKIRIVKDWSEVPKQITNCIVDRFSLDYGVIAQL